MKRYFLIEVETTDPRPDRQGAYLRRELELYFDRDHVRVFSADGLFSEALIEEDIMVGYLVEVPDPEAKVYR